MNNKSCLHSLSSKSSFSVHRHSRNPLKEHCKCILFKGVLPTMLEVLGLNPGLGDFMSESSAACDVELDDALYLVFQCLVLSVLY